MIALSYASLLEGAVLTETVFAWPGIGRYLTTAMFAGDMPAILGATLVVGASFVLLNALTDLGVGAAGCGEEAMSAIVQTPLGGPSLPAAHAALALGGSGRCIVVLFILALALLAPLIAPYDPNLQETANRLMPPDAAHWFGTDGFGRDILSRIIYGARPTLLLVLVVVLLMAPLGILVGILSGFFGGMTERVLMRITDIVMSFPRLLLAFAFVAIMGPGLDQWCAGAGADELARLCAPGPRRDGGAAAQRLSGSGRNGWYPRRAAALGAHPAAGAAFGDHPSGARPLGHYPCGRRPGLSRSRGASADSGMGFDGVGGHAGDLRSMVGGGGPRALLS